MTKNGYFTKAFVGTTPSKEDIEEYRKQMLAKLNDKKKESKDDNKEV